MKFKGAELPELETVDLEKLVEEEAGPVSLEPAAVFGVKDFVAGLEGLPVCDENRGDLGGTEPRGGKSGSGGSGGLGE